MIEHPLDFYWKFLTHSFPLGLVHTAPKMWMQQNMYNANNNKYYKTIQKGNIMKMNHIFFMERKQNLKKNVHVRPKQPLMLKAF